MRWAAREAACVPGCSSLASTPPQTYSPRTSPPQSACAHGVPARPGPPRPACAAAAAQPCRVTSWERCWVALHGQGWLHPLGQPALKPCACPAEIFPVPAGAWWSAKQRQVSGRCRQNRAHCKCTYREALLHTWHRMANRAERGCSLSGRRQRSGHCPIKRLLSAGGLQDGIGAARGSRLQQPSRDAGLLR